MTRLGIRSCACSMARDQNTPVDCSGSPASWAPSSADADVAVPYGGDAHAVGAPVWADAHADGPLRCRGGACPRPLGAGAYALTLDLETNRQSRLAAHRPAVA